MPSVLFVCTANICRSPMAAALFKNLLGPEAADWRIESAGTWAKQDQLAPQQAVQIMECRGIYLYSHRSRGLDRELLSSFSLILVMEKGHKEALRVEFPDLATRIFLLSEMVGEEGNIVDPVGGSSTDFHSIIGEIERYLRSGLGRIRELAGD